MITVIAGVNGAGKSSVFGSRIRALQGDYFNPDEIAQKMVIHSPDLALEQANALAWEKGLELLNRAIEEDTDYTFETTLGGNTITDRLHAALDADRTVRILYCGLTSPELHIQRVFERVSKGGHNIPEHKIRQRWHDSIHNMMSLIPRCHSVRIMDNSGTYDQLKELVALKGDQLIKLADPMPEWAKPLAVVAIKRSQDRELISLN